MSTRKITVYSTQGQQMKEIESDASEFSQLKSELESYGYSMDSLHATENVNRTDLVNGQAKLPEGEFTIFLRPKKTKSGATSFADMGFKELRSKVTTDTCKAFLNSRVSGKNWTQLSTDALREGLEAYYNSVSSSSTSKTKKIVKAPIIKELAQTPMVGGAYETPSNSSVSAQLIVLQSAVDHIKGLDHEYRDLLAGGFNEAIKFHTIIENGGETESQKKERLDREARELMRGY